MRSRRWKFAASLGLLLCLSASIAVGGFAADASVAEQGYPGGGDWGRPSQAYGYAPWGSVKHNGHYYFEDGWKKEAAATCVSAEKWVNKCVWTYWDGSQCGEEWVEWWGKKDPNNHVNTETRNQKKATCTEEGYTGDLYCKDCKTTIQTGSSIPANGHKWGQWTTTKKATCTEAGIETRKCKKCGKTEERETKVLGHDWDNGVVTTPATCTENGVRTYTCKRDSRHTKQETIPKTEHTPVPVPAKAATCTETGLTEGSKCQTCGVTLVKQEVTPALDHDWDNGKVTTPATCTKDGVKTYTCKRDSSHTYTEAIPATDHMYGKEVVEPTCTEPGYTKYTCAYCGDSYTTDEKPVLGHEEVVISGQNPTCEAEGWTESSYCKRCNVTLKAKEIISAQGHDPIAVPGKEPTCTETGLTEGSKCQRCGKILTAQETIPALGHDWNTTSTGVDNCVNVSFRHENETVTLCPICGVQNGTQRLNKVTLYTAHAKLVVLRGVLENGMEAMTVAFYEPGISSVTACQRCGAVRDSFSSGASLPQAAENAHFTVDASLVDGYTVMLVQADGTETVLTPGISNGKAIFDVDMKGQGARLLHLVPTTAA